MPDPIKLITRRITTMTYQAIDRKAQFIWGNVLSRNPDGTLNVDDGKGGCVLIVPPANARTGDRISVDLGAMIAGVGMPAVATYAANVPQKNHMPAPVFIDNIGDVYNATSGARIGSGGTPTADVDKSFGYYHPYPGDGFSSDDYLLWAGAASGAEHGDGTFVWHDVQIGTHSPGYTGYEGESYYDNNTVLCAGIGLSAGVLCGAEHKTDGPAGGNLPRWVINLRDSSTFDLVETNAADYIHNWMVAHPDTFHLDTFGSDEDYDVHVSPDPSDGSFWVNLVGGPLWADPPGDPAPMFNVSAADGSLIRTVSLAVTNAFFRRAHLVQV